MFPAVFPTRPISLPILLVFILVCGGYSQTIAQAPVVDRDRGVEMLKTIKQDLKDYYYDSTFHGINVDTQFKEAETHIKAASSTAQILGIIAQTLINLNDSHTSFIPPQLVTTVDYGFKMQMIGTKCYAVVVKPASVAAAKGLRLGDEIYSIDGFAPDRDSFWKMQYSYYVLAPAISLTITVRNPNQTLRQITVASKFDNSKKIKIDPDHPETHPPLYGELSPETVVVKLREFDLGDKQVDEMMKRVSSYKSLIIDLRGNPGGSVLMLQRLLGYFFDHDVKIGDRKGRKETTPLLAKSRAEAFKGPLDVLVDSESASASEVFARIIQLEKRGTIIGDQTPGMVMAAYDFVYALNYRGPLWDGPNPSTFYGASITVADLLMSDGKSLEHVGVAPDLIVLPDGSDFAQRLDPALVRAAAVLGVSVDADKAGKLFPLEDDTGRSKKVTQRPK